MRFTDVAKARGFYTWKDKVESHNNRVGFLKNCMAHWGRNLLFLFFRRWAEANHGSRKRELERRIVMQDEESQALKQHAEQESKRQHEVLKDLADKSGNLNNHRQQYERQYNTALQAIIRRVNESKRVRVKRVLCRPSDRQAEEHPAGVG